MMSFINRKQTGLALVLAVGIIVYAALALSPGKATQAYIVQGHDLVSLQNAVEAVGGEVTHKLGIINAVGARLSDAELRALKQRQEVRRVYADSAVEITGKPPKDDSGSNGNNNIDSTYLAKMTGAVSLHQEGITGDGVTIAVVDTGTWNDTGIVKDPYNNTRLLAEYDAVSDSSSVADGYGHGTHVTSIAVNSRLTENGEFAGIAPDADVVSVRAFDDLGRGTYADVIRGLDWIVANKDAYDIRVLNLSFSAPPQSYYWDDPLNQAVMAAWQAGIVVVASAGNTGPDAMTIGAPGNVPYVITVGSMTDNYTPDNQYDDFLATFSSAGPRISRMAPPASAIDPGTSCTFAPRRFASA